MTCNICASTKTHIHARPDACTCIFRYNYAYILVRLVLACTVAHRNDLKKCSKLKWNRQSFNKNFLWEIAIDLFPVIKLKGLSVHFSENCMHETEEKKLHHHNIIYIVDSVIYRQYLSTNWGAWKGIFHHETVKIKVSRWISNFLIASCLKNHCFTVSKRDQF